MTPKTDLLSAAPKYHMIKRGCLLVCRDIDAPEETKARVTKVTLCTCTGCAGFGTDQYGQFRESFGCPDAAVKGISGTTAVNADGVEYLATVELSCSGNAGNHKCGYKDPYMTFQSRWVRKKLFTSHLAGILELQLAPVTAPDLTDRRSIRDSKMRLL